MNFDKKEWTTIHNLKFVENLEINCIDKELYKKIIAVGSDLKKSELSYTLKRLNFFLFLSDKKISLLSLHQDSINSLFEDFIALTSQDFFDRSSSAYKRHSQLTNKIINYLLEALSLDYPKLRNFSIDLNKSVKIPNKKLNYYNNCIFNFKNSQIFVNFMEIPYHIEDSKYSILINKTQLLLNNKSTFKSGIPILNSVLKKMDLTKINDNLYLLSFFKDFCFNYFKTAETNNRSLPSSIISWNYFVDGFIELFIVDNLLNLKLNELPKAPVIYKKPFEKNIKSSNGFQIKNKLLTDIPLQLTDNESVEILFRKIDQDIAFVNTWADYHIEDILKRARHSESFDPMSLGHISNFKFIYRNLSTTVADLMHKRGIPTNADLEPFMFKLINEHPEITESQLTELELYDENDNLNCVYEFDGSHYLKTYKNRRGSELSEKLIKLNDTSKQLIYNVIYLTEELRQYLKDKNDSSYKYLFLTTKGCLQPCKFSKTTTAAKSHMLVSIELRNRVAYFTDLIGNSDFAIKLVENMSLTKFRASKGIQAYIKTGDSKKMANVLGHARYKPELLASYLPEPILHFFKERWIRIFQKGIICEAMKDSQFLLESSNFKNFEELDTFLTNHSLKNIPNIESNNEKDKIEEIYISIDENILTALFSIEELVNLEDNKSVLKSKAVYWADFSKKLYLELIENIKYANFKNIALKAKNNTNKDLFKDFLYA